MADDSDKTVPPSPPFTRDMLKNLLREVIREESEKGKGKEKPGESSGTGESVIRCVEFSLCRVEYPSV